MMKQIERLKDIDGRIPAILLGNKVFGIFTRNNDGIVCMVDINRNKSCDPVQTDYYILMDMPLSVISNLSAKCRRMKDTNWPVDTVAPISNHPL